MAVVSGRLDARRSIPAVANPVLAIAAITLLALVLRLHDVALDPFWKNELFSLVWSQRPAGWLASQGLLLETNPPLHFLLLKAWTTLFGTGEFSARLPSVLSGTASVPLLFLLGRRLGGTRVGMVAAGVMAITPMQIFYAHEARAYALLPGFLLIAMLGLCRFLQAPDAATGHARWGLVGYGLGSLGLIYSHGTAGFVLMALLLALASAGALPRRRWWPLALATLLVLAGAAPQIVAMAAQAHSPNIEWMDRFSGTTLMALVRTILVGPMVAIDRDPAANPRLPVEALLAMATALLLAPVAWRAIGAGRPLARGLVVVFPLLFVAIASVVSLERPILVPRVGIWLGLPVALAAGFLAARPSRPGLFAGAMLAACLVMGLQDNVLAPLQHKPHWPEFIRDNPDVAGAPLLVAGPHTGPLGLFFYAARGDGARPSVPRILLAEPASVPTLADQVEREATGAQTIDMAGFLALIREGRAVRLVYDDDDAIKLIGPLRPVLAQLPPATLRRYPGLVAMTWNLPAGPAARDVAQD